MLRGWEPYNVRDLSDDLSDLSVVGHAPWVGRLHAVQMVHSIYLIDASWGSTITGVHS